MSGSIKAGTKSHFQLIAVCALTLIPLSSLADTCVNGTWLLDESSTTDVNRYQVREAQRFKKRTPVTRSKELSKSAQAETGMPGFVFDRSALEVRVDDAWVHFDSDHQQRRFSTQGATRQVSLSDLQDSHSVIASWEDKRLIVETTLPYGAYIVERMQLTETGALQVNVQVATGFARPFDFIKLYERREPLPNNCLERFKSVKD